MKKCSKCNIEKELSQFYVQKASNVGYRSECRECTKLYNIDSILYIYLYLNLIFLTKLFKK